MKNNILYQTKPVECWRRLKELQAEHRRRAWGGRQEGRLLVAMTVNDLGTLVAGLGPWDPMMQSHMAIEIACDRQLAVDYLESWENAGYARDMCSDARMRCSTAFSGHTPYGAYPRPDFLLDLAPCEHGRMANHLIGRILDTPVLIVEYPFHSGDDIKQSHIDWLASQMWDAIEQMERIAGREYRDDLLVEAIDNEFQCKNLWGKTWLLDQAVPAPLSQKQMVSLGFPMLTLPHTREAVEFCRTLLDEVKFRVENRIASLATERCRLLHEGLPPYYFPELFEYVKAFGALFVTSRYDLLFGSGSFLESTDGSWEVAPTLEEQGIVLRNREDALKALAERRLKARTLHTMSRLSRANELIEVVEGWHIDGVVMHLDRGCKGLSGGMAECRRALQEQGIPYLLYEANSRDPRDMSETEVMSQLDSFMEGLGLSRIDG